jgi:thymidylate kinase
MLGNYKRLFSEMESQEIKYCSWKNNQSLVGECNGNGDIDLLVNPLQQHDFELLLSQCEFIKVKSAISEYPFIQHYYCYDKQSDKFGHLHVYYKLVTGDSHLKNYRFPFESQMLESSHTSSLGIKEASPHHQAELYMARRYIKSSSLLGLFLLHRESAEYQSEYNYINSKILNYKLNTSTPRLFHFQLDFQRSISFIKLIKLRFYMRAWHRGVGLIDRINQLYKRILNKLIFHRKKTINGSMVAIAGLDGSGKSSAVEMLSQWLSDEFTVQTFHFGRPPTTWVTWPIRILLWVRGVLGSTSPVASLQDTSKHSEIGILGKVRYLALAFERNSLMKKANRFSLNGGVAILDRYPSETIGKMDSPRIADQSRLLGRIESILYKGMPIADLLLKLNVDVEEAVKRNNNRAKEGKETDNEIRMRFSINSDLKYNTLSFIKIDTMLPMSEVHQQLRIVVWSHIVATN